MGKFFICISFPFLFPTLSIISALHPHSFTYPRTSVLCLLPFDLHFYRRMDSAAEKKDGTSKKRKKHKKKSGGRMSSNSSMREASIPRLGRALWPPICDSLLESWRHNCRDWLARLYAFAVPNEMALNELSLHSPIVEVGAGTGYWSSLLKHKGVDIVAYDIKPPATDHLVPTEEEEGGPPKKRKKRKKQHHGGPKPNEYHGATAQFCEVLRGDHNILSEHKNRTLFLCYPPPNSDMASNCLNEYKGNKLV